MLGERRSLLIKDELENGNQQRDIRARKGIRLNSSGDTCEPVPWQGQSCSLPACSQIVPHTSRDRGSTSRGAGNTICSESRVSQLLVSCASGKDVVPPWSQLCKITSFNGGVRLPMESNVFAHS